MSDGATRQLLCVGATCRVAPYVAQTATKKKSNTSSGRDEGPNAFRVVAWAAGGADQMLERPRACVHAWKFAQ